MIISPGPEIIAHLYILLIPLYMDVYGTVLKKNYISWKISESCSFDMIKFISLRIF